jgi:hypothetical protein
MPTNRMAAAAAAVPRLRTPTPPLQPSRQYRSPAPLTMFLGSGTCKFGYQRNGRHIVCSRPIAATAKAKVGCTCSAHRGKAAERYRPPSGYYLLSSTLAEWRDNLWPGYEGKKPSQHSSIQGDEAPRTGGTQ